MARIRTVKPEYWEDELLGTVSRDARLLYVATWNFADDAGRLRWSTEYVKAQVFPYDADMSQKRVRGLMDELEAIGRAKAYTVGAQQLAWLPFFRKHQKINRPQPPKFEPHPDDVNGSLPDSVNGSLNGAVNDTVNESRNGSLTHSPPEGKGRDNKTPPTPPLNSTRANGQTGGQAPRTPQKALRPGAPSMTAEERRAILGGD